MRMQHCPTVSKKIEIHVFNEPTTEFDEDDIRQGTYNIHTLFLHFNFASNSKDSKTCNPAGWKQKLQSDAI